MSELSDVLITFVQRFSVNDGPGIRTNVFIKGCPLHCPWCHNPETISSFREIYWKPTLCTQCGNCFEVCPQGAIRESISPDEALESEEYHKIMVGKCNLCMKCVESCPNKALEIVGVHRAVDDIIAEIARDIPFYKNSGGGMTVSGGEPFTHPEFVGELLRRAKELNIHNCVDTCGFFNWDAIKGLVDDVDIFLFDIKHIDSDAHRKTVGIPNELILANLGKLSATNKEIRIRIPVIPGFNNDMATISNIAKFLKNLSNPVTAIDLLPFHDMCRHKYRWLGRSWPMDHLGNMEPEQLKPFEQYLTNEGFTVTIGG
ncbi:MAG: glycyl-radical enzyme activating protein [Geobacteraceae bacterium]